MEKTAALPTAVQFTKTLETTGQAITALVGIRSRTVKIPANVKRAMRNFAGIVAWAKKQPEVYAAALATQAPEPAAGKKTRKAGA
jgi:hypothetical protein